jgi:hypothetical protein
MFWGDLRKIPTVEINCAIILMMLEETVEEYEFHPPDDQFVEDLTRKIEQYISIQLNKGLTVSIHAAFTECC